MQEMFLYTFQPVAVRVVNENFSLCELSIDGLDGFKDSLSEEIMVKRFKNRKASFQYFFIEEVEAGIVLTGTEIKSLRDGKMNFKDSYARIDNGEVWLVNLHISPYEKGTYFNHDPERRRKLLLHRREIKKLLSKIEEKGMTLIPKDVFINDSGLAKVTLALAKGKHTYDKSDTVKERDERRDMDRAMKGFK